MSAYRYHPDGTRTEIVGDELTAWQAEQAAARAESAANAVEFAKQAKLAEVREAAIARVVATEYGTVVEAIEAATKDARLTPAQKRAAIEAIEISK